MNTLTLAVGIITAIGGSGGVVFAALRFNRENADSLVDTMKAVGDELRLELARTQDERNALRTEVTALTKEISALRIEISSRLPLNGAE